MKTLAHLAAISSLVLGCQNSPSKLEGNVKLTGSGKTGNAQLQTALTKIDERLKALETAHKIGGGENLSAAERIHRIETSLGRREEALGFLELAYQQQKRQIEAQEANEHDPTAIFAVDISGPIKAGQVEGPNSAIVTVVEAWDFA
jgi:hypothetical protein